MSTDKPTRIRSAVQADPINTHAVLPGQRLQALIERTRPAAPLATAIVQPVDAVALNGALEATAHGLIAPVLVGPSAQIRAVAEQSGLDLADIRIVDVGHAQEAATRAVTLVRTGEVEALMKGALHTEELMHAVVARHAGLRTEQRMSHVFVVDEPTYPRLLLITDAAINIMPDLMAKRDIVQNAIDLARALGIEVPKVAIVCAVETINAKMQATLDAAALCKMADRGQIIGGTLDGPLALDNAVSPEAATTKHIRSEVAGRADVLVVPDLECGNMIAKQLEYLGDAHLAGMVVGARVPIMLTSRADNMLSRLASCAVATRYRQWQREGGRGV
ncbi:Phosphate acetyltransferase [Salinisphaera sp. LB1]|nr:bifunctional enoyl-CoA hydratase/phosphate acetyltransferase [Salinisphaera sp. LB1]AWN17141.1 Phosphate acetyltransferase [Salinisphaera sp. LB1]